MQQRNGGFYDPDAKQHDYRIEIAPCNITGETTKVIRVLLNTIDFELDDGTTDSCQIWAAYSAEGLLMLQQALAAGELPVDVPDPGEIRANLKYYWLAVYADGTQVRQWPDERHFGHLDVPAVQRFFLLPKEPESGWPSYCLDREEGLLCRARPGEDFYPMRDPVTGETLPFPTVPFHLEYLFRPTVTMAFGCSQQELFPVRVRHELGWRVDQCHGDAEDTWFLIAIEDEGGDWQIHRKEPLTSRHFERDGDGSNPAELSDPDGPKVIEGQVRIIDAFAGVGA